MSDDVTITPLPDGPLEVSGPTTVQDPDGTILKEGEKAYLCRCGFSGNKPFCDGSHKRNNWTSS